MRWQFSRTLLRNILRSAPPYARWLRRQLRGRLRRSARTIRRSWRKTVWSAGVARLVGPAQAVGFVLKRLRGEQVVKLRLAGISTPLFCRTSGSDPWVLWQVFRGQHAEIRFGSPPRLIVDGGANVGYVSLYFANRYPGARIVAVEPDPENCELFRMNCAAYPNIELVEAALWPTRAHLIIDNPDHLSWGFRVAEVPSPMDRSFEGVTVGDILERHGEMRVDLLKLDVEGSEERLFSSGHENWIGRVEKMLVEVHGKGPREAVLAATKAYGFSRSETGGYLLFEKGAMR